MTAMIARPTVGDNELPQRANVSTTPKIAAPAGEQTTPTTRPSTAPRNESLSGSNFTSSHTTPDHRSPGTQDHCVGGAQTSETSQTELDTQTPSADLGPILADPLLGLLADVVDDLETVRVANENRLRALTAPADRPDNDGICRGFGLTLDNHEVARIAALVDAIKANEDDAIKTLERNTRRHPLGKWAKGRQGIGDKQLARLLVKVGDPYWNDLHNRPRTVSELWAYCGFHVIKATGSQEASDTHGDAAAGSTCHPDTQCQRDAQGKVGVGVAPKRTRGQKSNWSEDARKRAWLIAASCVKQKPGTPYRDIYDATRAKYAEAVHATECVRCGPKGKPAQPGSPLSAGHQHARALRAIAKAVLKDVWREAKRLHETNQDAKAPSEPKEDSRPGSTSPDDHGHPENQPVLVVGDQNQEDRAR